MMSVFQYNYENTKYIKFATGGYSFAQGTYLLYKRVNEAWCKVGNETLEPLQSVRVKGKRWNLNVKSQSFFPKCNQHIHSLYLLRNEKFAKGNSFEADFLHEEVTDIKSEKVRCAFKLFYILLFTSFIIKTKTKEYSV